MKLSLHGATFPQVLSGVHSHCVGKHRFRGSHALMDFFNEFICLNKDVPCSRAAGAWSWVFGIHVFAATCSTPFVDVQIAFLRGGVSARTFVLLDYIGFEEEGVDKCVPNLPPV